MSVDQRQLRNRLRARGRAIGDKREIRTGNQDIKHLIELAAYEHWHRLLFTRFLTENNLLITDEAHGSVPVTLEECEELAPGLGARDGLDLACRFASLTLPGVFRRDDPVLELQLALNDQVELRKLLADLPSECFRADDALGWTYQFWQAQRKKEVDKSGIKIGADELSPVTQLFTEDYMVEFLLHNTLGAWWAGKLGPIHAATEQEARAQAALSSRDGVPAITWNYLRFLQDEATGTWSPAAGSFDRWPRAASLIRLLDPCMGSGHFLVFALPILVRLRIEEEQLSAEAAMVAVLKDNIHGLELDERCTQIAAFNVALTAWKLAGYQALPSLHIACSGLTPSATEAEWMALAGDDERARNGMARLHSLFKEAPVLGSLINPHAQGGNLIEAEFHQLAPLLTAALAACENQKNKVENDAVELAVIAQGLAKAAELLAGQFTLVITNVPYLGRGKQDDVLKDYCERIHPEAKADLSTCFVERCLRFCTCGGSTALVTPQNWFFLSTYKGIRRILFQISLLQFAVRLGPNAFRDMNWWAATTALLIASAGGSDTAHTSCGIDVSSHKEQDEKAALLRGESVNGHFDKIGFSPQQELANDPDALIVFRESGHANSLDARASSNTGLQTGDNDHYSFLFWELPKLNGGWEFFHRTSEETCPYGGRIRIIRWESGAGSLVNEPGSVIRGLDCRGKRGVLVHRMNELHSTLYTGDIFDQNGAAIIPHDARHLAAIWCFLSSPDYHREVRVLDSKTGVTPSTLGKVPFDVAYWQAIADEKYPD
ncbi:MAG TPA: N-6 DNA methylase, partial [Anaerolineales bacterium]|nr:N-6 DNA methylase [Anaerolineales bacterium]